MISPSSASFTSVSGIGGPTVPGRTLPGRLIVVIALVSDIPQVSQISIPIARKNSSTSGGVGAAPTTNHSVSSRPSMRADRREDLLVGLVPFGLQLVGNLALHVGGDAAAADLHRPLGGLAFLGVLLGGHRRLQRRLQFLPDPRHAAPGRRPHLDRVGDHLARVRAAVHACPVEHLAVVDGPAVGDVGAGQEGDACGRRASTEPTSSQARQTAIMLAWVSCTPFGGPVVPEV